MAGSEYHGRFVWHELLTSDPEGAKRFYPGITGWGTQEFEGGPMPYTMWTSGGATLGGVMQMPDEVKGVPPYWMPYIGTPDVDDTHRRAVELGGVSHVPPTDIPSVGRFAVIADPQGAVFTAFTPGSDAPEDTGPSEPAIGRFSWNELATTDVDAAFRFYSELFRWEKTSDFDMGPMGAYQMYGQEGIPYGGIYTKPAEVPGPAYWLCYVRVPDVHEAARATKEGGGKVLVEPMEVPGGDWIVQLADPAGAAFAVHQKQAQP